MLRMLASPPTLHPPLPSWARFSLCATHLATAAWSIPRGSDSWCHVTAIQAKALRKAEHKAWLHSPNKKKYKLHTPPFCCGGSLKLQSTEVEAEQSSRSKHVFIHKILLGTSLLEKPFPALLSTPARWWASFISFPLTVKDLTFLLNCLKLKQFFWVKWVNDCGSHSAKAKVLLFMSVKEVLEFLSSGWSSFYTWCPSCMWSTDCSGTWSWETLKENRKSRTDLNFLT